MRDRLSIVLSVTVLAVATLIIYSQVIHHSFVWDTNHIFSNEALRSLSFENIAWMLGHPVIGNWHPLTWLSHMVDYSLFGHAAGYHHLVNVAIHLANSVLVFFLVRQLCALGTIGNTTVIALVSALVFTVHPLRVESVAWVAARKDLLYAFFFLISIGFYLRHRTGERYAYFISIGAFLASLLSKSMAVTLPAVLLILDLYLSQETRFLQKITEVLKYRLVDKLPYLLFTIIISAVTLLTQSEAIGEDKLTVIQQLKIPLHNLLFYVEKFFAPVNLSPFYPFPSMEVVASPSFWLPGAAFLVVTTIITVMLAFRSALLPFTCWSIYLVSLLPASGIIHVGSAVSADRYTYLPHLSITVGLIVGIGSLLQRMPIIRPVVVGLAGFWLIGLTALSYQQVKFWTSPVSLWTQVLRVNPGTAVAHRNISTAYYLRGEYALALEHIEYLSHEGWPVTRELTAAYLAVGDCTAAGATFDLITPENPEDARDLEEVRETIEACASKD
jgi:protein O-mannosyl-transferase